MFSVKADALELRGVSNRVTKSGRNYLSLNVEDNEGFPYSLYCPKPEIMPQGLKKGDKISVTFAYSQYHGQERLIVSAVSKAI